MGFKDEFEFVKYCFSRRKDGRFVKNVMAVSNDHSLVNMEETGGSKTQEYLYHISMEPSYSGFFADHNRLLSLLYYADYYGMQPVVEYGEKYSYYEDHPVNGTENPFEYYFKQPAGITISQMKEYKAVLKSRKENAALAGRLNKKAGSGGYGMTEEYISALGEISRKYIRLNDVVAPVIRNAVEKAICGKCTIGVHVRGTDFKHNYSGHPICITPEEYLEQVRKLLKLGKYERVFLATDDNRTIELFEKEIGDKLVYYTDVTRSDGDETVMKSAANRENHHYLLGLEVLRDMMTLAACDGLVAGLSQVSYSARIQKKSYEQEYDDMIILNKGINYHRENCPK